MELELVMEKAASRSARFLWLSSTLGPGEGPGMIGIQYPGDSFGHRQQRGGGGAERRESRQQRVESRHQTAERRQQTADSACSTLLCSPLPSSTLLYSAPSCSALLLECLEPSSLSVPILIRRAGNGTSRVKLQSSLKALGTSSAWRLGLPAARQGAICSSCTHSGRHSTAPLPSVPSAHELPHERIGYPAKSPFEMPPSVMEDSPTY